VPKTYGEFVLIPNTEVLDTSLKLINLIKWSYRKVLFCGRTLIKGIPLLTKLDAAKIVNCVAGIVVGEIGTASVTPKELMESLAKHE